MDRIILCIGLLSIFLCQCSSIKVQSISCISCNNDIIIQYEKENRTAKKEGRIAEKSLEAFSVTFLNIFNDDVEGYINNKLVFKDRVISNEVTGKSSATFGYNYSNDQDIPILKVSISNSDDCFDIPINLEYKLIYVFRTTDHNWIVRYSNIYYLNDG